MTGVQTCALPISFRLLKKDSIYTRFFAHRSDLSDVEIDHAVDVDFVSEVALVVTTEGASGETIIASARYVATDAERPAEAAFVVEEDYQRRGIASRLLAHLAGLACLGVSPGSRLPCLATTTRCSRSSGEADFPLRNGATAT